MWVCTKTKRIDIRFLIRSLKNRGDRKFVSSRRNCVNAYLIISFLIICAWCVYTFLAFKYYSAKDLLRKAYRFILYKSTNIPQTTLIVNVAFFFNTFLRNINKLC